MAIGRDEAKKRILEEDFVQRMKKGLEKIIDGHLLIMHSFTYPDHPDMNRHRVYIDFEFNATPWLKDEFDEVMKAYAIAYESLREKYAKIGWDMEIRDTNNGRLIALSYKLDTEGRKKSMEEIFGAKGHQLALWNDLETKCLNPDCELRISLCDTHASIAAGNRWLQWPAPCPATYENTSVH